MTFTARELRAITYVARKHHYNLTLSQRPWIHFVCTHPTRHQGSITHTIRIRLSEVLEEYDHDRLTKKLVDFTYRDR